MADKKKNPLKVITPKFRLSFPELFTAKAQEREDGTTSEAKFSLQMLFDKKTDLTEMRKVVDRAAKEKWGDNIPKGVKKPFRDGNEKELDGYEDMIVVSATSKFKPQIVDRELEPIMSQEDIYPGCYARAAVVAYAWEHKNKKGQVLKRGVSFRLEAVMKWADGESFVSRADASELFEDIAGGDGSNDDSNYEDESDDFDFG